MGNVNGELKALESLLSKALEQVDNLKSDAFIDEKLCDETAPAAVSTDDDQLVDRAQKMLKWNRIKADALNHSTGLFSDSCWNMCLDIYICDLKDEQITVSSVAHSSGIPMTTAMRYINVMAEEGLLEKTPNPSDHRMVFVSTSTSCKDKISDILKKMP